MTSPIPMSTVLDALVEGIQVIGPDWRYQYVNPAAAGHGRTVPGALVGKTMMACYPGIEATEMFAQLERCMTGGLPCILENEFQFADGSSGFFELRVEAVPDGICILSLDISERRRAEASARETEERSRHRERLEALGRLSAGIAHDFNNLLGVLLGLGEVALARPSGPKAADVEGMMDAARRAAVVSRELLTFGRRQIMQSQVVDAHAVITGLSAILRAAIGADVELVLDLEPAAGCIEIDPTQLEQILMNLVLNARDATPSGGRVTVALAPVTLGGSSAALHPDVTAGPYVLLSVIDNGVGMDAGTRARIFEPFFTTKARDTGTGLGLATVHGIVHQCGGTIWVYSEPGMGTTFKLYFPRVDAAPEREPEGVAERVAEADDPDFEGDEAILVVEDHASLRALAAEVFSSAGYRVVITGNGVEALAVIAADPSLALVVTDVIMPGMSGLELVARAREIRPGLRFLCTSGYASASLAEKQALPPGVPFLEKPYLPSVLLARVREILDAASW